MLLLISKRHMSHAIITCVSILKYGYVDVI